jgi:hypothetical protein
MKYKVMDFEVGDKNSLYQMPESCILYLTYLQSAISEKHKDIYVENLYFLSVLW